MGMTLVMKHIISPGIGKTNVYILAVHFIARSIFSSSVTRQSTSIIKVGSYTIQWLLNMNPTQFMTSL